MYYWSLLGPVPLARHSVARLVRGYPVGLNICADFLAMGVFYNRDHDAGCVPDGVAVSDVGDYDGAVCGGFATSGVVGAGGVLDGVATAAAGAVDCATGGLVVGFVY